MRKILPFLAALLLLPLPLASCAPSDGFHAGRPITKEELASVSAELFTSADEPESEEQGVDSSPAEETPSYGSHQTVYWPKDGKTYHADRSCSRLEGEFSVKTSTRRTAEDNGLRPCKDCVKE